MDILSESLPQLYPDIPGDTYHAMPGLSSSQLKSMAISPAHFYGAHVDPLRPEREDTPQFKLGRLVHTVVLEPDKYVMDYAVIPDGLNLRTKAGKAELAEYEADHAGKEMVKAADVELAFRMRDAVMEHSSGVLLDGARVEHSGWWYDDRTGELLKYRPDARTDSAIIDLKTTAGPVDYDTVQKAIWNFNYHTSAAHYLDGDAACMGTQHNTFVLLFVSKQWPHEVGSYYLDPDAIELGRRQNRTWLHRISDCFKNEHWPPVNDGQITEIGLPPWAMKKLGA